MSIFYQENALTAENYRAFQKKMKWNVDKYEQIDKSLKNDLYDVVALREDEVVGMGRLVGDGVMYWYVQDVFVLTECQRMGIGTEIVNRLIDFVKTNSLPQTEVSICLMSALGKEEFYEKLGFKRRPNEGEGAGMEMNIIIK